MIRSRRTITAVILGLVATAAVYADMVPVSPVRSGRSARDRTDFQYTNLSNLSDFPIVANLDSLFVEFSPEVNPDISQTSDVQNPVISTDGTGSFSLCLYALISLGLCSSAHRVKNLSFGFVPEWYHSGGPFQVGHSYAVTSESLCLTPVYCFIQPVYTVEDSVPQYRLGIVVSLWRKSQFTPEVIASRGPPDMS
jgi:hypothetical protein